MNPVELSEDQLNKLNELSQTIFNRGIWRDNYDNWWGVIGENDYYWLEFCLYHLLPKVAQEHGKQPFTTPNWSEHMVRQKIINELPTTNPIDTLYDIWKHPEKYAQTL